jgi:Cys-rich protein (TIGR01571 family)
LYGCFCTPCLFAENVKKVTPEKGFFPYCCGYLVTRQGCCYVLHKPARQRFREAYGLQEGEGISGGFCATWCCSVCGVCQEAREIKVRGKI